MSLLLGKSTHRYITPVHRPYPGYLVQIPHPDVSTAPIVKVFAGNKHSLDYYLGAAIMWRDVTYKSLYEKPLLNKPLRRKKVNSNTGILGVSRIVKNVHKKSKSGAIKTTQIPCIIAEIHLIRGKDYKPPKGSRSKVFSINKYGEQEALRLATLWREEMLKQRDILEEKNYSVEPIIEDANINEKQVEMNLPKISARIRMGKESIDTGENSQLPTLPDSSEQLVPTPGRLVDFLIEFLGLKFDRDLASALDTSTAEICRWRKRNCFLGPISLLKIHDLTGIPVQSLRRLMGDRREVHRIGPLKDSGTSI